MLTRVRKVRFGKGFTLIELLIVIAIILILIAIALPNFLEAQIRARVTKVKGELRSLETALMSYFLDWNVFPNEQEANISNRGPNSLGLLRLSTPIKYIAAIPEDPFSTFDTEGQAITSILTYESGGVEIAQNDDQASAFRRCSRCMVMYAVWSKGPDVKQSIWGNNPHRDRGGRTDEVHNYSATNGTKSEGSIYIWGGDLSWIGIESAKKRGNHDVADKSMGVTVKGRTVDGVTYVGSKPRN